MISGIDINGKFLSASPTGVHRVAHELTAALARRNGDQLHGQPLRVLAPRDTRGQPSFGAIPVKIGGLLTWQFWEQFSLPWRSRGHLLVSLCNLAPVTRSKAVTMIHDAQVFLSPASYSRPFRAWYSIVLPAIGRRHRRILTVSEYSRQQLAHFGVAPLAKIHVVPNGADHILQVPSDVTIVDRLGLEAGNYVVGLANLQAHKNIPLLLRAFADPRLAGSKLVLVGGADAAAFAARGHAVPPNVVFAGKVSDGGLRGLLEQACCLAFPSTTEGFGLPPLEAMILGCPAIVAPCGALPEVCGEAAVYCSPDDPAAWAGAIGRFLDDATWRDKYVAASQQHAALFTWDRAAGLLEESIAAAISSESRSA
ncbi:MAG: glycosyltransferase family 1 protein [Rhizorhabdus sp.]